MFHVGRSKPYMNFSFQNFHLIRHSGILRELLAAGKQLPIAYVACGLLDFSITVSATNIVCECSEGALSLSRKISS